MSKSRDPRNPFPLSNDPNDWIHTVTGHPCVLQLINCMLFQDMCFIFMSSSSWLSLCCGRTCLSYEREKKRSKSQNVNLKLIREHLRNPRLKWANHEIQKPFRPLKWSEWLNAHCNRTCGFKLINCMLFQDMCFIFSTWFNSGCDKKTSVEFIL